MKERLDVVTEISPMSNPNCIVIHFILLALLLSGCYSYQSITERERSDLINKPSENIEVTMKDGSSFQADEYHYVFVDSPSQFIYGVGSKINTLTGAETSYAGIIQPTLVDSSPEISSKSWTDVRRIGYNDFSISDSLIVRCNKGDFFNVDGDVTPRLWFSGHTENTNYLIAYISLGLVTTYHSDNTPGNVPQEQIQTIEVQKFSALRTILFGVHIGAIAALLFVATQVPGH